MDGVVLCAVVPLDAGAVAVGVVADVGVAGVDVVELLPLVVAVLDGADFYDARL